MAPTLPTKLLELIPVVALVALRVRTVLTGVYTTIRADTLLRLLDLLLADPLIIKLLLTDALLLRLPDLITVVRLPYRCLLLLTGPAEPLVTCSLFLELLSLSDLL